MGMTSAHKLRTIVDDAYGVIAIELIAAAQALDLRDSASGPGVRAAHAAIRRHVRHLDEDRPLHDDNNRLSAAVRSGEILAAVENAVGRLES
jgi:histidine ammonia-lyase